MVTWFGHPTWLLDMAYNFIQAISQSHDFSLPQTVTTFWPTYDLHSILNLQPTFVIKTYIQYHLINTSSVILQVLE